MLKHPVEIFLSFSTKCNLKCKHCYSNSRIIGKTVDVDNVLRILNEIKPLRLVISGGEPLLDFRNLIRFLHDYKKKYKIDSCIVLATNGTLLNRNNLKKLKPYIDRLQISLDTLSRKNFKKIRGVDLLSKTIEGIKNAKKDKFDIQIAFALFKENLMEIKDIIFFCEKNNINKINVLRQRPIGRSKPTLPPEKIKQAYMDFLKYSKNRNIKINIHDPISNVLGMKSECIAAKEIAAIDFEGNFKPCPLFDKKVKGNFNEIWNSNPFFKKIRGNVEECKSCDVELCNGGCKACSFNMVNELKKDPWCIKEVV